MTMKNSVFHILVPAALAACLVSVAWAHQGATGIVKERMDQMGGIAKSMKAMGAMFKGETSYDAETVRALATDIAATGGKELSALFPEHSLRPPSEARHEIWTDWDKFLGQGDEMQAAALALANGAANPTDGSSGPKPADLFRDLAQTCKSCHQDFRIKK